MIKLLNILQEIQINTSRLRVGTYISSSKDEWIIYKIEGGICYLKNPNEFKIHGDKESLEAFIKSGEWKYSSKEAFENKKLNEIQILSRPKLNGKIYVCEALQSLTLDRNDRFGILKWELYVVFDTNSSYYFINIHEKNYLIPKKYFKFSNYKDIDEEDKDELYEIIHSFNNDPFIKID